MKTVSFLLISLFFTNVSFAGKTDGQFMFSKEDDILLVTPKAGFHLNKEAPASVVFDDQESLFKPTKKNDKQFEFKIASGAKVAKVAFYMCDDKLTVCEQHQEKIVLAALAEMGSAQVENGYVAAAEKSVGNPTAQARKKINSKVTPIVLNPSKSTLYMFSAPWCPACLRMKTETLNKPEIKKLLKQVNFVILNSDLPDNHELSTKYAVKAIPTLVLVSPKGEEVFRWLDYQEAKAFEVSLTGLFKNKNDGKDELTARAQLGDQEAISKIGMMAYNTLDCGEAIRWLNLSKQKNDQKYKLAAEAMCAEDELDAADEKAIEYKQTLMKAMTMTTSNIDRLRWFVDYLEKSSEKKTLSSDLVFRAEQVELEIAKLLQDPKTLAYMFKESTFGETRGFEVAEMQLLRMKIFSSLGKKSQSEQAAKQLIDSLSAKKYTTEKPGEMLLGIAYLREAGEKKLVEKYYKQLIAKYTTTYVYYEKYSRFLLKEKRLSESLGEAEKALNFPEGNRPQLYLLKSRVLKELNQTDAAKKTIDEALALQESKHERYKKVIGQLNKLQQELTGSALK